MLNPFPIQFLALIAYLLLRVITGSLLVYLGLSHYRHKRALSKKLHWQYFPFGGGSVVLLVSSEIVIGLMFIAGFYTQIAALLAMMLSLAMIIFNTRLASAHLESRRFYTLLFAIALSLFITGAGAIAFDLPI